MKLEKVLLAIIVIVFSIFATSCGLGNQSFKPKTIQKPIPDIKSTEQIPQKTDSATEEIDINVPIDFAPINSDALVTKENFGVLPPIEEKTKALDNVVNNEVSEFEIKLNEIKDLNNKFIEENNKLKNDLELAARYKIDVEYLRTEFEKTKEELYIVKKTATNSVLFLTINQPEVKYNAGIEHSVGIFNVLGANSQKLYQFANIGTVESNQPGTLTIKTVKGDIVSQYKLRKDVSALMSIPDNLQNLIGDDEWHVTFKSENVNFDSNTVIYFSLTGAKLKDKSNLLVSDDMLSWALKPTSIDYIPSEKQTTSSELWLYIFGIVVVLAIVSLMIMLKYKKLKKPSQIESFYKSEEVDSLKVDSWKSEKISSNIPRSSEYIDTPFKIADDLDDDLDNSDFLEKHSKSKIPPPRDTPFSDPTKERSGTFFIDMKN